MFLFPQVHKNLNELLNPPPSPEYRLRLSQANDYHKKIAQAFSPEFFEEFWQAHMALAALDQDAAYQEGLQTGLFLMARALLSA